MDWMLQALLEALVWVVGAGLALGRWGRHPRVSLLALLACLLQLAVVALPTVVDLWLLARRSSSGDSLEQHARLLLLFRWGSIGLDIVSAILLLAAAFA